MTADLSKTFNTLTVILNNRLRYKVKIYLKFLEPISILIIAIFVGLIVLAIMLPLFNLGENLT
ncbi:type II secretion system F family protein [uncultured Sneathia sp.]